MSPAPWDSWARVVSMYASNKLVVAADKADSGCIQTALWERSLECCTCQTGPKKPSGRTLAGVGEGHMHHPLTGYAALQ